MIRILIVDDSDVVTMLLKAIFEEQPDMEVIACAHDGREAVELVARLKPDLVTMDIQMPIMDGLQATREIMSSTPVPIVVVSSAVADKETEISFKAIEHGALWVIEKPPGIGHPDFNLVRRELIDTARTMAGMKLLKRRNKTDKNLTGISDTKRRPATEPMSELSLSSCELIAIGCSTGGPQALQDIVSRLPADFSRPIVVVQHISKGFTVGMVDWLQLSTSLILKVAEQGERLLPGSVYFAPDDYHLKIERNDNDLVAILDGSLPINRFRPSATPLFESVADTCPGAALGILLTGMGHDGAHGLLKMREAGCHTIAQDQDSCVVFGMPAAALELEAVDKIVVLDEMANYLISAVVEFDRKTDVISQ